jgi:DNA repair protein RadC
MKDQESTTEIGPTQHAAPPPISDASKSRQHFDPRPAELLADVLDIGPTTARSLLNSTGNVPGLFAATHAELVAAGLTPRKATRLRAALELAQLGIGQRPIRGHRLAGAGDVWVHMRARLQSRPVEEFWAIALDVRHRVVFDEMVARGSLSGVEIHPRDVFRPLIRAGAAAVIFCHNHPSGDPAPSRADIELTQRLREVGDLCGIPVLDHVVVGSEGFASLAERNWR